MVKVVKKVVTPKVEEKVVLKVEEKVTPPVEEKKVADKKPSTKGKGKGAVKAVEPAEKVVEPVELYPATITAKSGNLRYERMDGVSYAELRELMIQGAPNYPYRILLREEGIMTQFAIMYVGRWLNAIDVSSKSDERRESIIRYSEAEYDQRESGGFPFGVYKRVEITPAEAKAEEVPPVEEKVVKPIKPKKPVVKK